MAISQTNLKTEDQSDAETRTPWQKSEYERRRTSYKKEFKNICLKHIQFLKRKESIVDFSRLFNVWQLYIKYRKLETAALLKYISSQSLDIFTNQQDNVKLVDSVLSKERVEHKELLICLEALIAQIEHWHKNISSNINLLDKQIADLSHDINEVKHKNSFVIECLTKFMKEFPDKPELAGKDFVHVLHDDHPSIQIDGKLVSDLADTISMNLVNDAHKLEMKIQIPSGNIQELEVARLITILETRKKEISQQKAEYDKFNECLIAKKETVGSINSQELQAIQMDIKNYRQTVQEHHRALENKYIAKEINLELDESDFTYNMLQLSLLEEQELADINTFEYRSFVQQENIFKKTYRKNQADNPDFIAEIERKLIDVREYKESKQSKIQDDFATSKAVVENNISNGKTTEEITILKAQHKEQFAKTNNRSFAKDAILPVPPTPQESKFNLEKERNAVLIAIAQTVCESLGRLALATGPRSTPISPQEHAGVFNLDNTQISDALQKNQHAQGQSIEKLNKTRKEICKLGEEINELIRGLE